MSTLRRTAAALAVVTTLGVVGACSGSSADDTASTGAAERGAPVDIAGDSGQRYDDAVGSGGGSTGGAAPGAPGADPKAAPLTRGRPAALDRAIAYVGELRVEVDNVSKATLSATAQVRGAGGTLFAQESSLGDDATALLTFKVPPAQFERLLNALAELGRPQGRTVSAEDITEQLVDLEARLRTAKASTDRVRALLARAGTITEIVALEREVASREAEVESMTARLRALDGRVEESTLTLLLSADRDDLVDDADERGFLAGLRNGWDAFVTSMALAATVLGAVLPFAALALVTALAALAVVRRRRAPVQDSTPAPAPAA